ncbi:hypothetical protein Bca52824_032115 [Brassica carinata]|uniref:RNase H type-1 domain-containing protein n=1 Tax=Brassica carinata TaxID=52824 RepID=A0A8X7V5W6_BRACI|nr:hypothetical protein Bca52824_032115 [Brassica carinata]
MAQRIEEEFAGSELNIRDAGSEKWRPPRRGWVMCNIAVDWKKDSLLNGGAWVVRDDKGVVVFHSRHSFGHFRSRDQAKEAILL